MHNLEQITDRIVGGPLEWGYVDEKTGLWAPQGYKEHNLVLYGCADILAKLAGGNASYAISTMYFEYTNSTVPTVTPTRSTGQSYYSALHGDVNLDFIRSAIDITPTYATSDVAKYANNIARFFGVTNGATGNFSNAFSQSANSKVYGGALVASPTGSFSDDVVFARFYFSSPCQKLDGQQIGIRWGMLFN